MSEAPELQIERSAPVERVPLGDGSSWVDVRPGFARDPGAMLDQTLATTEWMHNDVWRFDRYVEERRLGAWLRPDGLGNDVVGTTVRQTGMHLESAYRVRFSGVSAILYRNGEDFQGLHSDREMKWLDDTLIAILVLGENRPFVLRPRGSWTDPAQRNDSSSDVVLRPGHGDMIVMGGRCQRDWLHGVPAYRTERPRVSVTWRWTSRHGRPDTSPSYFDGKHFSDRPRVPGTRRRPANS
ncbi:alpha-ketoglutarate-dependent dioxygenase AlkB [soil metagenome]